ncbi:unnamed protein product [Phytophthora lilii]|uniref:Unnamed protein product n=1 Tax=Phytophthora lilii TaxID=2077276 RepID=A0A9W6XH88_9STRA|nr:unnamed protein product [Phytophthora lilii]
MALYETGTHFSAVISPRRAGLTRQQKRFCQELVSHRLKPVRVLNALRVKFGLEGDRLPRLRPIQNLVNYYSKTQLGYNDDHEDVTSTVRDMAYDPSSNGSTPITFTYNKSEQGDLVVGDGSDEEPFVVGITTKNL